MRKYAALYVAANDQCYVIYQDDDEPVWYILATVEALGLAQLIAEKMNQVGQ